MQGDAKFWIVSAALGLCGCPGGVVDEPQRKLNPQTPLSAEDPYNVIPSRAGNAGAGGQFGKGGATSAPAGGAGTGGAGTGGTGGAGTGGAGTGGAGTGGAGTGGAGTGGAGRAAGSSGTSASAGSSSEATPDCPSLTRVRLANGACADRVTEFSVATNPTSIATGSDGRIWFDDGSGNRLVQLDDQGRVLAQIALKAGAGSSQRELVGGSGDVILWYSDSQAKTLTSLIKGAMQPKPYSLGFAPTGLSLGEPGEFWLTEAGQAVHRVNPGASTSTRFLGSPNNTVILGPDKNLWFPEGKGIARLVVAEGTQNFPISDSFADDICAGPDGALWFTDGSLHQIGRMEVDGTLSRTYDLPLNSSPFRIIVGPDGALWFTEQTAEKIGRISVKGVITHYPIPSSPALPTAITVGPDHNLWFTEVVSGKIGRLIPDAVE